jgi:hypothetical protein
MLLGAEANAAEALEQQMLSRLDEQTFVGGKHVPRQHLPDLPEHAETTAHRVKVSLLDLADPLAGHPAWAWAMRASSRSASRRCRSAPVLQPRASASAARARASTRWAARTARWLGVGAEAGTMLADVGIRAGALCLGAQPVAAGQPGLDGGGLPPVAVDQRQRCAPAGRGGQRPDLLLGQGERALVLSTHDGVEQAP